MVSIPTFDLVGSNTVNFVAKTASSPLPAMRSYTNLMSTISQFTGVEYDSNEGINFTANDIYEKSGNGYEKGDFKLTRKLEKSVISPLWQMLKFANPSAQLEYLEMVNKNAQ
jgi:hypothetical protein